MPANDFVRARIDPAIKDEASKVLATMGLTVSDVCRMALTRVAYEKRLPFSDPEPNELTRETIEKAERGEELHYAKDADDLFRQLSI
jgi:DNA-damage-inducible protein J